ncbi:hypothetical protein DID88_007518 [Monilinia fructigena]|uniref:Uncharacterized protein n=1 Tax=Monilinia fructigena TaxID=38457 RepID=A0A395J2K7_9HELO|nr:hypothetical protein DID88_007518 [Monilinia fructigena]
MIIAYTASRSGAIIELYAYYLTGQALLYKNIKFTLQQNPNGGEDFTNSNYLKNQILDQYASHIFSCLAFADNVFATVNSIEELVVLDKLYSKLYIDQSQNEGILWSYQSFLSALQNVVHRAGFKDKFTSYIIRRTAANLLNEHATQAEKGKILGHSNDKIFQNNYLSFYCNIDLQSLIYGQEQRKQQINFARSLSVNRGLPFGFATKEIMEVVNKDPQVVAAANQIAAAETECCKQKVQIAKRNLFY